VIFMDENMEKKLLKLFEGKTILVTGGCGSIGLEIVKQVLEYNPKVVRVFDNDENGHFMFAQTIENKKVRHLVGDIRDRTRIIFAMKNVDIVFHAAALKHVLFCEYNPFEAVNTNVIGTKNVIDAVIKNNVESLIGISTDKAVNPINTMGATKLLSEKIITNAPIGSSNIKFCCVRFGNVLASSGSVIPIFKKQIKEGNTITITSKEMTRFFMSISDAVSLVLKAATLVNGGETFILKMDTLKITDLAEVMVEELAPRYGKKPEDINYKIVGVRAGEKIYESLMTAEESQYMTELDDMIVLHDPILSEVGINEPLKKNGNVRLLEYDSRTAKSLNKEQIRKILYEKKII